MIPRLLFFSFFYVVKKGCDKYFSLRRGSEENPDLTNPSEGVSI